MSFQSIFKRYEIKFLLSQAQKSALLEAMRPRMQPDQYGATLIRSLYFDNDSYRLIRRSLERPAYKEKLRLRSYRPIGGDDPVFVELKKKYKGVVYKRRVKLPLEQALGWLGGQRPCPREDQICREIGYFCAFYGHMKPTMLLTCKREAYIGLDDPQLRITFDEDILAQHQKLSLDAPPEGAPLLPPGKTLMEIKCAGAIPLWLTQCLSKAKCYKTSFSKYGTAYQKLILPNLKLEVLQNGNRI